MSQYILDTDHVSLILSHHPQVTAKASVHQIAVTIIIVQELIASLRVHLEKYQKLQFLMDVPKTPI